MRQTAERFELFREQVADLLTESDDIGLPRAYMELRELWIRAADEMFANLGQDRPFEQMEPFMSRLTERFEAMRTALDRITEEIVEPQLRVDAERLTSRVDQSQWVLFVTLLIALLLGAWLTAAGVRAIRTQHEEIVAERDAREQETKRKEFDQRVQTGLGLVQTEREALGVVGDALNEILDSTHQGELLLADSSRAHLERVVATRDATTELGCKVPTPQDCPAIRRNSPLNFPSSRVFETCPYLRHRGTADGCSAVCVPLSIMGRTAGVLHVVGSPEGLPDAEQCRDLQTLAVRSGDEIGLVRAFATKDEQANTDTLTGLCNRRSLEARLPSITRNGRLYTVAFTDLDKFKKLNDAYGHEIGDRALRLFADALTSSLRPDDVAARWGGEEFVVILPGVSGAAAVAILERIRSRLREMLALGPVPRFTASFGVSDSSDGEPFETLLHFADDALRQAKRNGRDQIVYAGGNRIAEPELDALADDLEDSRIQDTRNDLAML